MPQTVPVEIQIYWNGTGLGKKWCHLFASTAENTEAISTEIFKIVLDIDWLSFLPVLSTRLAFHFLYASGGWGRGKYATWDSICHRSSALSFQYLWSLMLLQFKCVKGTLNIVVHLVGEREPCSIWMNPRLLGMTDIKLHSWEISSLFFEVCIEKSAISRKGGFC